MEMMTAETDPTRKTASKQIQVASVLQWSFSVRRAAIMVPSVFPDHFTAMASQTVRTTAMKSDVLLRYLYQLCLPPCVWVMEMFSF